MAFGDQIEALLTAFKDELRRAPPAVQDFSTTLNKAKQRVIGADKIISSGVREQLQEIFREAKQGGS